MVLAVLTQRVITASTQHLHHKVDGFEYNPALDGFQLKVGLG